MSVLFGILLTLAILTIVVFVHEVGHFLAARMTGMNVKEFGMGIPPKAKSLFQDKKGTEYTINWLPIGGFVRIKGEDPSGEDAGDRDSFSSKKWWARALVLVAGVAMNFFLAWTIFSGLIWGGTSPLSVNGLVEKNYGSYFLPSLDEAISMDYVTHSGITITPISSGPADQAGIASGSLIKTVNERSIASLESLITDIKTGKPLMLSLQSPEGEIYEKNLIPKDGIIQAYLRYSNLTINTTYRENLGFFNSFGRGFTETVALSHMTLDLLGSTFKNLIAPKNEEDRQQAEKMVSGPIGMGKGMVDMVHAGLSLKIFLLIVGLLSVNLGVLNILPFPALDGGRLVSTSVMAFVGLFTEKKSLLITLERWVHGLGMLLLIGLSLFIAFLDIFKLF